jgi:hypothetical protein
MDETAEQSTIAVQVVAAEPAIEKLGEANDIGTTAANDAEDDPVGAIQSSDEARAVDHSIEVDEKSVRNMIETVPAHIVARTEPAIEKLGEANDIGTKTANDAEDDPIGAIQSSDEPPTFNSTRGNDDPTVDDTITFILIDRQLGLSNE